MGQVNRQDIVIEIGAEGGSITVVARTGEGGNVEYSVRLRDQSLTLLQGDDADNEIRRDSAWTDSWDEAIAALGRWPWPMLYPRSIHPDYVGRVLMAVNGYRGRDGKPARKHGLERWTEACRRTAGT